MRVVPGQDGEPDLWFCVACDKGPRDLKHLVRHVTGPVCIRNCAARLNVPLSGEDDGETMEEADAVVEGEDVPLSGEDDGETMEEADAVVEEEDVPLSGEDDGHAMEEADVVVEEEEAPLQAEAEAAAAAFAAAAADAAAEVEAQRIEEEEEEEEEEVPEVKKKFLLACCESLSCLREKKASEGEQQHEVEHEDDEDEDDKAQLEEEDARRQAPAEAEAAAAAEAKAQDEEEARLQADAAAGAQRILTPKGASSSGKAVLRSGPWTKREDELFLLGLQEYGKYVKGSAAPQPGSTAVAGQRRVNCMAISHEYVVTRSPQQISKHARVYYRRLEKGTDGMKMEEPEEEEEEEPEEEPDAPPKKRLKQMLIDPFFPTAEKKQTADEHWIACFEDEEEEEEEEEDEDEDEDEEEEEEEVPPVQAQVIPGLVTTQELHTIATYECSLGESIGQAYPHTFRVLRGKKVEVGHRRRGVRRKYKYDDRQEAVRTACMEGLTRTQPELKLTLDDKVKEYRRTIAPPNNIGKLLASCPDHIDKFRAKRNLKSRGQIMVVVSGSLSLKFDGDDAIVLNAGDGYIADKRKWRTLHQVFVPHGTVCERGTWRLF
ncbi:Myb-like domain-containing protein [Pycnococcus provasolii]